MQKIFKITVCLFSAWTAGQQISVHSLGEGPRGAGLENRSVLDLLLGFVRNIHGSCMESLSILFLAQDIESDSLP